MNRKPNYLHPANAKYDSKNFRNIASGKTQAGVKISQFEAVNPSIPAQHRNGILISQPNGQNMVVYGGYNEINAIAREVRSSDKEMDRIVNSLRTVSPSPTNSYILNEPDKGQKPVAVSEAEAKNYITAQKMFPSQDKNNAPTSIKQDEQKAFDNHMAEVSESQGPKVMYPSASDNGGNE